MYCVVLADGKWHQLDLSEDGMQKLREREQ